LRIPATLTIWTKNPKKRNPVPHSSSAAHHFSVAAAALQLFDGGPQTHVKSRFLHSSAAVVRCRKSGG
jgi:hypothetical protein